MYKTSENEIHNMIEWTNEMMDKPVEKKQLATWVNDTARTQMHINLENKFRKNFIKYSLLGVFAAF